MDGCEKGQMDAFSQGFLRLWRVGWQNWGGPCVRARVRVMVSAFLTSIYPLFLLNW
jgi:hypothetical protein